MKNEELREKILDLAMNDLQFADDNLCYVDGANNAMIKKLNTMTKVELENLFELAKGSRYYRGTEK